MPLHWIQTSIGPKFELLSKLVSVNILCMMLMIFFPLPLWHMNLWPFGVILFFLFVYAPSPKGATSRDIIH